MKSTEKSKTILNIAIAISIVLCSLSLFIFSLKSNSAIAADRISKNSIEQDDGYKVAGIWYGGTNCIVFGYDGSKPEGDKIKVLARENKNK